MSTSVILAILVTSLATFSSRFLGVVSSEGIKETSKLFRWFNCLAYSTLAALIARTIIFPVGVLSDASYLSRIAVDSFTKKISLIFALTFFGPIIKQPVSLSLIIELSNLLNLLEVKLSKLFAIVNLVNGLYSRAVISNLLNGNINFSKISSSILISTILFKLGFFVMVSPGMSSITYNYLILPS